MQQEPGKLRLYTVGPLKLFGPDGEDHTPRGRKACAVLALLALAPENKRARAWIQDKLWSDRGSDQGSASLRQALYEIRLALGAHGDCLVTDRFMLSLDRTRIDVDLSAPRWANYARTADAPILLEGLDIRDPEFEDWIRDQRLKFEEDQAVPSLPEMRVRTATVARFVPEAPSRNLSVILRKPLATASVQDTLIADRLTDIFAKTISEISTIDVLDRRVGDEVCDSGEHALAVQASVLRDNNGATWRISLSQAPSEKVVWVSSGRQRSDTGFHVDAPPVLRALNQAVDAAIGSFMSAYDASAEAPIATLLCQLGIQHVFRLGSENLEKADQLFAQAFAMEPRGIYLAWRAYLRTYLLAERLTRCRQTTSEEALEFMHRALELEPLNSYVASFSAHVHTIVRRSHVAACEMAQRSIQLNRGNALGWACLGIAECHLGQARAGFKHTLRARELAGTSPFRFQIDGLSCIAGCVAGDFDQAIWCGEASHSLAPSFAPPLRHLAVLYLSRDEHERSQEMVQKLQALEPDFSYEMLREKSYPSASLQRSGLLKLMPSRQV